MWQRGPRDGGAAPPSFSQLLLLTVLISLSVVNGIVLTPPNQNLAYSRKIVATHTCGEVNGSPIREMYCTIAGANPYSPHSPYSYKMTEEDDQYKEMQHLDSFLQNGQNCDVCMANSSKAHPASNMVDGLATWWMSPPLSRGMQYREVNITIDLEQEFHVAYVFIQMANSPRPGTWILERSTDYGKTYQPWQYFASSPAECSRVFGLASLSPITEDDSVICTSDYSGINQMENGEIVINLLENRPGKYNFTISEKLQNFVLATHVRIRLLRPKTLHGHFMDLYGEDPHSIESDVSVTRRYYYAIKEIMMGGRCVCNGHAASCDVMDITRPRTLICRCEHNTAGDKCERCQDGFVQKRWRRNHALDQHFECEPCNCHGHSEQCVYDAELDEQGLSLDIHGNYAGGGRCLECRDNTDGINCNQCSSGYYRPAGKHWNETNVCQECVCDSSKHTGNCADETGACECLPKFAGANCDVCAEGYYHPPVCRPCLCNVNGTENGQCLPNGEFCPCKPGFSGQYCETCAAGFTNVTAGCVDCNCDHYGSMDSECNADTSQCVCKSNFGGLRCEICANGYYNHPSCDFCDCDPTGTESNTCDQTSGQCLCKIGFSGRRCEKCDENYFGYPNCQPCECDKAGALSASCDGITGECICRSNFTSRTCDRCAAKYYHYPECLECSCDSSGSKGVTCDNDGQCYCKPNFQGLQCDQCGEKLYNFPICEECNCHPSGVIPEFAGCDKVAPGELCTCRANVMGRTCSQCKPTYWDLQPYHPEGCLDCACNKLGTISMLNSCDQVTGQCPCKMYVTGLKCDECAEGFYNMRADDQVGCQPCNCNLGQSNGFACDQQTGQCSCKAGVQGLKCDELIDTYFFSTPQHIHYEAEEGHAPDGKPVRFAIDAEQYPNFSYRGYIVFSPIQDEIILDVKIPKSSMYDVVLYYKNPTQALVDVELTMRPTQLNGQYSPNNDQKVKVILEPNTMPTNKSTEDKKFVLNPGSWQLSVRSPKRLFLDYVVLIPVAYTTQTGLIELIQKPCKDGVDDDEGCVRLNYPPIPSIQQVSSPTKFQAIDPAIGTTYPLQTLPKTANIGEVVLVETSDEHPIEVSVDLDVPKTDTYHMMVRFHSNEEHVRLPVHARVEQDGKAVSEGILQIKQCDYTTLCTETLMNSGVAASLKLDESPPPAKIVFTIQPGRRFKIASVHLVNSSEPLIGIVTPKVECVWKNGKCVGQSYDLPPKAIPANAGDGPNANYTVRLPVDTNIEIMSLDNVRSTVDVEGVVASPGEYVFVVHYFNPDNHRFTDDVLVQHERFADADFEYCPSTTGCRVVLTDREHTGREYFHVDDKYTLSFYHNPKQMGPLYISYVIAVPRDSFTKAMLKPIPLDLASDYIANCSSNNFANSPSNVSEYCRNKIFSIMSPSSCSCNAHGSLDFSCDKYGGQCHCKPNVIGRTCNRCAPGHYNFPDCQKCECFLNQQCDESNGQCFCPRYVEGKSCDRCVRDAFGYDPLIGCQLCGCSREGSNNGELECDTLTGQCLCKENVGGRRCDKCLPGFYAFPHCTECACADSGTTDDVCDAITAKCLCKKNVIGERCDTCKPGTFDLRKSDLGGCSDCYCFGVTDRCSSSPFPIQAISLDDQAWTSDDPAGRIEASDGRIVYHAPADVEHSKLAQSVYLEAPIQVGGDYTASYGLHMSFVISSFPSSEKSSINAAADVQIVSGTTTLEYWAPEQPSNLSRPFKVVVTLFPEYWLLKSGEPASRAQLMIVLLRLEKVRIKASYYKRPSKVELERFELEMAAINEPYMGNYVRASSVEVCECPPPYTGPSCQRCAPGYYRVPTAGSQLGSCVPCNCHGHSGTCDPDTGVCSDCQHHTMGNHCEFCVEGFYGNATTGSPSSCLRCACPFPTETNNFAISCAVSEIGTVERCVCRDGYAGESCETCQRGYYGQPTMHGAGECRRCFCNNNNDLNEEGACHLISGDCALCAHNTDGRHCEYCKDWFYGDAIQAKNCTECSCDQCGSEFCDNVSGICKCHPLVEGRNCDRCVENAWNFQSCRGCQMCECGVAASNSQCDAKTGQCACLPGAGGRYCERCEAGYWDYGPQGCKKCDCEADLSMGTVCDVNTGQCHCQVGASGPRCDTCIENYLKVPKYGCRQCDECVYALNTEFDAYDISVEVLRMTLGNVSGIAVTGARLRRVQHSIASLEPKIDNAITLKSDSGELTDVTRRASSLKDASVNVEIRADRVAQQLDALKTELDEAENQLIQLRQDIGDLVEISHLVIERIEELRDSYHNTAPVENPELLIRDAERLLTNIDDAKSGDDVTETLKAKRDAVQRIIDEINEYKVKAESQLNEIHEEQERIQHLAGSTSEFTVELHTVRATINNVKKTLNSLSLFPLNALLTGIEKDQAEVSRSVKAQNDAHTTITQLIAAMKEQQGALSIKTAELAELKNILIRENPDAQRRLRRQVVDTAHVEEKAAQLERQSGRIVGIYDAARLEAASVMDAANAYKEVRNTLQSAKNYTQSAQIEAAIARKIYKGKKERSREALRKSDEISFRVYELDREAVASMHERQNALQTRVNDLMPKLEKTVNEFQQLNVSDIAGGNKRVELDAILDTSDDAHSKLQPLNSSFAELQPQIEQADKRVKQLIESNVGLSLSTETADDQLKQVEKAIPESKTDWEEAKLRLANTTSLVEECKMRLAHLKEKIAIARDKANSVKLAAHFEVGSMLELPVAESADNFGFFTEIRLFFRTRTNNGLLLYFGSNEPQFGGEFITIEVENGHPRVTLNFGRESASADFDTRVSDFHWREIIIERIGKQAHVQLTTPEIELRYAEEKMITAPGTRSILNLFDDSLKLFVGGLPSDFRRPTSVRQHTFVGDLDKLQLNGDLVGFWNTDRSVNVRGAEMRTLRDAERSAESTVSLSGNGYLQLPHVKWNSRKENDMLFSFATFSPDGLLFFMGGSKGQLMIELVDGYIAMKYNLGTGWAHMKSEEGNYNNGEWHMLRVHRNNQNAKLEIDNNHLLEATSPGGAFEMQLSSSCFMGGLPQSLATQFAVRPYRGCIKNLKMENDYIDLNRAKETKGVQNSCRKGDVRVASLISERSSATFEIDDVVAATAASNHQIELALRFKTNQDSAQLAVVIVKDEEIIKLTLTDNRLVIRASKEDDEKAIRVDLSTQLVGGWHYVTVVRSANSIKVHVDDAYTSETDATDISDVIQSNESLLTFGAIDSSSPGFIGCIGDAIYNGHILSFAKSRFNEIKLMGCMLNTDQLTSAKSSSENKQKNDNEDDVASVAPSVFKPHLQQSQVRPEGSCALSEVPHGEREDSPGIRFGLAPNSRIEYYQLPDLFVEHSVVFSLRVRATASNGIIKFVANEKHTDFMALYLQEGRIHFAFGSGNMKVFVHGNQSILDGDWHEVQAEREGSIATLRIDDNIEAENRIEVMEVIDAQPPFYIGGLPNDLVPFAAKVLPGVKSEFGGCLHDFKLNGKRFDSMPKEFGTVSCSQYTENGIYFGREGGYAIINPEFVVGHSFSLELEIKPRTKNAVLLSVGALHFLTLQILNGTVKFSVDTGAGVESAVHKLAAPNHICDGHWHQIKLYKKKNIITLNVDGKSTLNIIKKKPVTENTTKDPLYLGGVPKDVKLKGLDTLDPYIGCVRIISLGKRTRRRKDAPAVPVLVDLSDMVLFGSVERNTCPAN